MFNLIKQFVWGDVNLDGTVNEYDKAIQSQWRAEHEDGWVMPAATNIFRPVILRSDIGLSGGYHTLALSGAPSEFKIYQQGNFTTPLLVGGQTITNGINAVNFLSHPETTLYIEAPTSATATLTYAWHSTAEAEGITCAAALKLTAWKISFIEDSTTCYNFSPSLGETGTVKVAISPALSAAEYANYYLQIEIVRETANNNEQHIDWLRDDANINYHFQGLIMTQQGLLFNFYTS